MAEEAARNDVESIVAVGTAGFRLARNRAELIDAVRHDHGVDVEVIPGDEEARLAYLATASELDVGHSRSSSSTPAVAAPSSRSAAGRRSRSG